MYLTFPCTISHWSLQETVKWKPLSTWAASDQSVARNKIAFWLSSCLLASISCGWWSEMETIPRCLARFERVSTCNVHLPAFFLGCFLSRFSYYDPVLFSSHAELKSKRNAQYSVPKFTWPATTTTAAYQLVWAGSCGKLPYSLNLAESVAWAKQLWCWHEAPQVRMDFLSPGAQQNRSQWESTKVIAWSPGLASA